MNIQEELASLLQARYVGEYPAGHMGAQILRFQRESDDAALVVKYAPRQTIAAQDDLRANVQGYNAIHSLGADCLLPPELDQLSLRDGSALVMSDLGTSLSHANGGVELAGCLWAQVQPVILATKTVVPVRGQSVPDYFLEVVRHIERFSHGSVPRLLQLFQAQPWSQNQGASALMLLDFTPDNLFLSDSGLHFIDPWAQGTYIGNPAVSLGQFAALWQIYRKNEATEMALQLKRLCFDHLPAMIGADAQSVAQAWQVGTTLQLVLSSYVRQERAPEQSKIFQTLALNLWS